MQRSMQYFWQNSFLFGANQVYLEERYEQYLQDPEADGTLHDYFDNMQRGGKDSIHSIIRQQFIQDGHNKATAASLVNEHKQTTVHDLINGYRLLGHLYSKINPLPRNYAKVPELELFYYNLSETDFNTQFDAADLYGNKVRKLRNIIDDLQKIYCDTVACEFMHIIDPCERYWLQALVEKTVLTTSFTSDQQLHILERLIAAEGLERYLGAKYPGAKRFSLEGCDSLIVALDHLIQLAGGCGIEEFVIGMAHRGRLNVLVNILGKMPAELFDEFEGKHYSKDIESGDVKYHQGFASDIVTKGGNVHVSLAFNPSHLEIVSPVMNGSVRARQKKRTHNGVDGKKAVLPIAIHGDAAFAGQGVVMETLNMSQTAGYGVGGTLHIIVNNQIGFTTSNPQDLRSSIYCSDVSKMILAPIFHVNAEDPQMLVTVVDMALQYRNKFHKDVVIDLIGYRKHGHNEADEPAATQPMMYKDIRQRSSAKGKYAKYIAEKGILSVEAIGAFDAEYRNTLDKRNQAVAKNLVSDGWKSKYSSNWQPYLNKKNHHHNAVTTCDMQKLTKLADKITKIPAKFVLHTRVQKIYQDRSQMTQNKLPIDWGYAENLAYAVLLERNYKIRITGQDSCRGTFFHRHAVLHDQNTGKTYIPLQQIASKQQFMIYDSVLSEAAVLGFEYGYSTSDPETLVIWEAQFGDFANNAQVVIDQFISSGEQKWGRLSGLVMFLPHGYEGQGPEHSSARLERYLQLCAQNNMQVCIPSTPAQVYHMLLRQMMQEMRKPLIVLTPKSLLRHKSAVSKLQDLAAGGFALVIDEDKIAKNKAEKVVMCSGKIYYELKGMRDKLAKNIAIIRIEQLYPFPKKQLSQVLRQYTAAKQVVWCQEEPKNQGAWYSMRHNFNACLAAHQKLTFAGREASAAPAVGYAHLHLLQQQQLLKDALL